MTEEPVETSLLYLLKQVELAVRGRVDAAAAELGLTMPKFVAMSVLARHPGMCVDEAGDGDAVRCLRQGVEHLGGRRQVEESVDEKRLTVADDQPRVAQPPAAVTLDPRPAGAVDV